MCSYGRDQEFQAFERLLDQYPSGSLSIVSDSYDLWKVMTEFLPRLRDRILSRDGKIIIRPDSGNPEHILLGDPDEAEVDPTRARSKGVIRLLDEVFGHTVNDKGYKVLDSHVGTIYGDGMYRQRIERVLDTLEKRGYASSNCVFGVGGILLQNHSRDDMGFAFKATRCVVKGESRNVSKDPVTDSSKRSHVGLVQLTDNFLTVDKVSEEDEQKGKLQVVFEDGIVYRNSWEDVVARASCTASPGM
jgi:nicotinamide phosphoribosyltransferase